MAVKHPMITSGNYVMEHPSRFAVWRGWGGDCWYADRQYPYKGRMFATFAEAINWAQKEARK